MKPKFLNKKGQASSVFNLLIAAVVAVAILTILMYIMNLIPKPFSQSPTERAVEVVKSHTTLLGTREITSEVTWQNKGELSARAIADGTGSLAEDQVCVLPGQFGEGDSSGSFIGLGNGGTKIQYAFEGSMNTKLFVLCDYVNKMDETLAEYDVDWAGQWGDCPCKLNYDGEATKCCIVAIVRD
ncbi:MAG: hypothetical protein V1676_03495 [Candidatus Diapherotrites archaeon]